MNQTITVLSILIQELPVGTNLALLHFFWMLASGDLLPNRGAIFPALKSIGLSGATTRGAWVAFRKGVWRMSALLSLWNEYVKKQPGWQVHSYEGYRSVPADVTAFWRPALKNCPSIEAAGEEGARVGVELAVELIEQLKGWAQGIYMMPQFHRYDMAAEIIEAVK